MPTFIGYFSPDAGWLAETNARARSEGPVGFDPKFLERVAALVGGLDEEPGLLGLLALRGGKIVVEEYRGGSSPGHVHTVESVTKSVASLLVGCAVERGLLDPMEPLVTTFDDCTFAHPDERKDAITLEDALTMRLGLDWREWGHPEATSDVVLSMGARDWVQYTLDLPMKETPGESFVYSTNSLLGGVLDARAGKQTPAFADEVLFDPLGIASDHWWVVDARGTAHTGGGLKLTLGDLAKLGQLVLQDGEWEGERVVPAAWLVRSFEPASAFPLEARGTELR